MILANSERALEYRVDPIADDSRGIFVVTAIQARSLNFLPSFDDNGNVNLEATDVDDLLESVATQRFVKQENNLFTCSCQGRSHFGVPCAHEFACMLRASCVPTEPLLYVNTFWHKMSTAESSRRARELLTEPPPRMTPEAPAPKVTPKDRYNAILAEAIPIADEVKFNEADYAKAAMHLRDLYNHFKFGTPSSILA